MEYFVDNHRLGKFGESRHNPVHICGAAGEFALNKVDGYIFTGKLLLTFR
jgi:hypothetical protein